MTVRARRLIEGAAVVAYPRAEGRESLARAIAATVLPPGVEEIAVPLPMTPERAPAQAAYDRAAERLSEVLRRSDVVLLCEGDPMLYGSFMYLAARLSSCARVAVTPGVSAPSACAAAAGLPLAARDEALCLVPATLPEPEIARLAAGGAIAVMKLGRHVAKVRRALAAAGLEGVYVERASTPDERVLPLAEAPDPAPYFSMALARRPDPWL
jgi:precorrin-2/cobalt-factor-2 C20-methyltransferase